MWPEQVEQVYLILYNLTVTLKDHAFVGTIFREYLPRNHSGLNSKNGFITHHEYNFGLTFFLEIYLAEQIELCV